MSRIWVEWVEYKWSEWNACGDAPYGFQQKLLNFESWEWTRGPNIASTVPPAEYSTSKNTESVYTWLGKSLVVLYTIKTDLVWQMASLFFTAILETVDRSGKKKLSSERHRSKFSLAGNFQRKHNLRLLQVLSFLAPCFSEESRTIYAHTQGLASNTCLTRVTKNENTFHGNRDIMIGDLALSVLQPFRCPAP